MIHSRFALNEDLDQRINQWLEWDKNEKTSQAIQSLVDNMNVSELEAMFDSRLTFGTAGIRGAMGPGPGNMNDLVIIQTTQGLVTYLQEACTESVLRGVAIGYDGRYNSKRFAELTAAIILNRGIPVYLFSRVCPTPFIPYTVTHFNLSAGIMITASHNPKEDNGYKVYWQNGSQIIPPHDKNIQKSIVEQLTPWETSWDTSVLLTSNLLKDPYSEVWDAYFDLLRGTVVYPMVNVRSPLKFTYTAMHGVGYPYMEEAFNVVHLQPFLTVLEQRDPDPEFPTVKFPNPEEGKSALDLAIKTADTGGSTVILANDPDADRLAVAEKNVENKSWKVFTGNELGALLGWWSLHCFKNKTKADLDNVYMLASTVSSKILKSMAAVEGFNFTETLTGFKWMGNETVNLLSQGKTVLFAFEEAIGFMYGTAVLDKDGISAGAKMAELACYLQDIGMTLSDKLADIYKTAESQRLVNGLVHGHASKTRVSRQATQPQGRAQPTAHGKKGERERANHAAHGPKDKYGHHISENSYYFCYNQDVIKQIFDRLRTFASTDNTLANALVVLSQTAEDGEIEVKISYPTGILKGKYRITSVRDLTTGYDSSQHDKKAILPTSKSSQMITFTFNNGLVVTLRTSGTEPKIKYYTELCAAPEEQNVDHLREVLKEMVDAIVEDFLQPEKNNLTARKV
uniref:(California timema) hypothetical protein n=1 Tax=Timema californicum TaxID=61474 RepID=A0A7R9J5L6_TIMCA|nr:unnamed protein product [Timema californicum]